ncbi:hypothetical protein BU15DRAFT_67994 [Melanogaster broomeanus]|nr:hypothetical protein BU15DRAFT_67994 [Melanogaster broomeanus]
MPKTDISYGLWMEETFRRDGEEMQDEERRKSCSGRNGYPHPNVEIDIEIQQWAEPLDAGGNLNKRRGTRSWKSEHPDLGLVHRPGVLIHPEEEVRLREEQVEDGERGGEGEGDPFNTPRRPHVGLGAQKKPGLAMIADAPLSNMLDSERPFLKPIKFVRSTFTPSSSNRKSCRNLFRRKLAQLKNLSGIQRFFPADLEPEDEASNQLEEIDFADPSRIRAEIDAVAAVNQHGDPRTLPKDAMEEIYCADLAMVRAPINAAGPTAKPQAPSRKHAVEETFTGVYNIKDTTRLSSSVDVNVQKMTPSRSRRTGETGETVPQEPTEALDQSADGTFAEVPDVLVVEEESPSSSSGSVDASVATPSTYPRRFLWYHLTYILTPKPPAADSCQPDGPLTDNSPQLFSIDTEPTRPFTKRLASDVVLVDRTGGGEMLGEEDELIVYVVPYPRSGRASPVPDVPRVKLPTTLLLTGRSTTFTTGVSSPMQEGEDDVHCVPNLVTSSQAQTTTLRRPGQQSSLTLDFSSPGTAKQPRTRPVFTPAERSKAALKARRKEARIHRLRQLHKAHLREEDERERRHPKWETRHREDSDVDLMGRAMGGVMFKLIRRWMRCRVGSEGWIYIRMWSWYECGGSRFVTMDDIEDEMRMRREDEEDQGGPTGSSDSEPSDEDGDGDREEHEENEEEGAFNAEEELLIAEPEEEVNPATDDNDGEGTSVDSSEDDDDGKRSPGSSFQARLRKIRERGRGKLSEVARQTSDADHSDHPPDDGFALRKGGADGDGLPAQINNTATSSVDITASNGNSSSANLHQGYVDEYDLDDLMDTQPFTLPVKTQWERDRAKKAEYKRQRHEARLQAAVDPLSYHKVGKKARKVMLAASKLNPEDLVNMVPNAIVDMASLGAQIRRFVDDIRGKSSMALPAMDKASRKKVHELAAAFGLSSQSKGNGVRRYTTLIKTTRTGIVKEGKVKAIMKRFGNMFGRMARILKGGCPDTARGTKWESNIVVRLKVQNVLNLKSGLYLHIQYTQDTFGRMIDASMNSHVFAVAWLPWLLLCAGRLPAYLKPHFTNPLSSRAKHDNFNSPTIWEEVSTTYEGLSTNDGTTRSGRWVIITKLKAINVAAGLTRIPTGFYATLSIGDDDWRTSNNRMCPTSGVVEWDDAIDLPLDVSAEANVQIYASLQLGNTLEQGELLHKRSITVAELIEHSHSSRRTNDGQNYVHPKDDHQEFPFKRAGREVKGHISGVLPGKVSSNVSNMVLRAIEQRSNRTDLDEAIDHHRATSVQSRFEQQGDGKDLDEAIEHHQSALQLSAPIHSTTLPMPFGHDFSSEVDGKDLDEAIEHHQNALQLRPEGHPQQSSSLSSLAIALWTQFEQRGDGKDLDEAIEALKTYNNRI